MNRAGLTPIFSLDNRFAASGAGTSQPAPCALPEDALAEALEGLSWARFCASVNTRISADFGKQRN